jgi:transcriptional regulator with XRE-family HTH domain
MPDRDAPDATTIRLEAARRAIAAEVRAEMARQNKSLRDLAETLNLSHQSLALRVRGDMAFRGDELVLLAGALGVKTEQFVRIATAADVAGVAAA